MCLQRQNATVTVVHSHTPNPAEITRNADIVIAAAGVPYMVQGHWLKPGAVVIDVGVNAIEVSSRPNRLLRVVASVLSLSKVDCGALVKEQECSNESYRMCFRINSSSISVVDRN